MFSQSLFFGRMGRTQKHTPHQTFPSRGRAPVPSSANNHPKATARALWCPIVGRMQYAPTLPVDCMGSFCQSSDLDAPSDVSGKGTNAVFGLCRWVIYWGRPGPAVPVCGAYAIRPYPDGRLFSSKWGGAQQHTPHQTSPTRGRMWFLGYVDG